MKFLRAGIALFLLVFIIPSTYSQQTTYAIIGDFGSGYLEETQVADLVKSWNPQFIVTTGDNRYADTDFDLTVGGDYCEFLSGAGSGTYCDGNGSPVNAFFPSTGNHEYTDGGGIAEYLDYFDLPGAGIESTNTSGSELYYDFVQGPIHFFVIDSYDAIVNGGMAVQQAWLQTQMEASTSIWKIVYFHHAPYSSSSSHGSTVEMRWPFADWGADAVLSGHDHTYERLLVDGLVYFVNGIGGKSIYDFSSILPESVVQYGSEYGAQRVVADDISMTFSLVDIHGTLIDEYTIYKGNPPDNNLPEFTSDPITNQPEAKVGVAYASSIQGEATDPDGDFLTFSKIAGSSWLSISTNGSLSGSPLNADIGMNNFTVEVNDNKGGKVQASLEINVLPADVPPDNGTFEYRISQGNDDVEENKADGEMYFESTDIELGDDILYFGAQAEGLLFRNINVPQGAQITVAYLEFECDVTGDEATLVSINAQAIDHAPDFSTAPYDLTTRDLTSATVSWDIPAWNNVDEKHQSPDISSVIQEVVGRPGWGHLNNMVFLIDGTGNREAESFEGEAAAAALLHIEYIADNGVNDNPIFNNDPIVKGDASAGISYSGSMAGDVSDPEGDALSFSVASGPTWLVLGENGTLSGMPAFGDLGLNSWEITVEDGNGGSAAGNLEILVIDPTIVEYCESHGNASDEWIQSVSIGNENNSSASSGGIGYEDFTDLPGFNVDAGTSVNITLVPGFASRSKFEYWNIWIDFDLNGDFDGPGELVFSSSKSKSTASGTIVIPDISSLETTMRVSMKRGAILSGCEVFAQGEVEDYTISINEAVPQPAVADFSADRTNISVNEVVQFTDQSDNDPETWSWTFEGGTPATSTAQNPSITFTNVGVYGVTLNVSNAIGSDTKTVSGYITVSEPSLEYCTSTGLSTSQEWIQSVSIGGDMQISGAGSGYSDNSSTIFSLTPGTTIPVELVPGFSKKSQREFWSIWIDYNSDYVFDAGEQVFVRNNAKGSVSGDISIPSAVSGTTKMRISMKRGAAATACEYFEKGEVEDYTVSFGVSAMKSLGKPGSNSKVSLTENMEESLPFKVYPNPASGRLFIQLEEADGDAILHLYDMTGKQVLLRSSSDEQIEIDISNLTEGIYLLHISNRMISESRMIIVE